MAVAAVLVGGVLMTVGQTSASAAGTPSSTNSTISVKPNPMLISGPDGSPSFEATVTVKDADGDPVSGDPVTLAVSDGGLGGSMLGSISENPQETDSEGKATFSFTCNAGYCYAGAALEVTASDPSGLSPAPVIEYVSEIAFAGRSYAGQTDTLKIQDLAGADAKDRTVTLSLDGSSVALSGTCATDATGSLPLPGEVDACTFTVPAVQLPGGGSPANVPAVVTVGAQAFDVTFPLQPAPALQLQPTGGPAGSTVLVGGTGFPQEKGVRVFVRFTPHGSGAASTVTNCQTDGLGGIEDEATGAGCQLTIPADSPEGVGEILAEEYDSLTEYASATATFTVEPPKITGIEISDNYPGCPGGPPAGPSCGTGAHDELYVGETAGLAILSVWNTGTTELLKVPAGGPDPKVSWSSEPQPSGAIALNGVNAAGDDIGLTAEHVTTSAGVVQAEYEGFKATSLPLGAVIEPCDDCFDVNGALLNVQANVTEGLSSKPLAGNVADITQGEEANGGRTGPPPCIPETVNGVKGCTDTGYEHLPASSAHTCTTESAGACQLIAEEGTLGESTEVEDTVTLTAPTNYTVTGVKGCSSVTGPSEAPVCHVLLGEFSNPTTITFELEPWPKLTVDIPGPYPPGEELVHLEENSIVNGAEVKITPIDGTPGSSITCYVTGGEDPTTIFAVGGATANCSPTQLVPYQLPPLPPGTYEVEAPKKMPEFPGPSSYKSPWGEIEVAGTDPQTILLKAGEERTVTFNTDYEPGLTVKVGAPESAIGDWQNEEADGTLVNVYSVEDGHRGEVAGVCTTKEGEPTVYLAYHFSSTQSYCTLPLATGTYEVEAGLEEKFENSDGVFFITSQNPKTIEVKANERASVSFNSARQPPGLTKTVSGSEPSGTGPINVSDGPVSVSTASQVGTGGGAGTVTVGQYKSDPEELPAFRSTEEYFDVLVSVEQFGVLDFPELTIKDCELGGGQLLEWWHPLTEGGHGWELVQPQDYEPASPSCITALISETSTPDVNQLRGTVFAVVNPAASTTSTGGSMPGVTTAGKTTPPATTAAAGSVSLGGSTIPVQRGGAAQVKLTCTGTATCVGKLTLTAKSTTKKGKRKHSKTQTIGTASFSIPSGSTATVKLTLNSAGMTLLRTAHGQLSATLAILESSPSPSSTQTKSVHLSQQKATKAKKGKKQ